jgi:cytochrome c556
LKRERTVAALGALGLLAVACGPAAPPVPIDPRAAEIIKARQANLKKLDAAYKAIGEEARTPNPDLLVFQAQAPVVAALAAQLHGWFPRGTGAETGLKTSAQSDIWSRPEAFKARADALVSAAAGLNVAVEGGDVAAIRAAIPAVGGACKRCHDGFRQYDEF